MNINITTVVFLRQWKQHKTLSETITLVRSQVLLPYTILYNRSYETLLPPAFVHLRRPLTYLCSRKAGKLAKDVFIKSESYYSFKRTKTQQTILIRQRLSVPFKELQKKSHSASEILVLVR